MDLHRLSVKILVRPDVTIAPETLIPVFHKWIQQSLVEGMLIDVADYKHVPEGPGIMLIGHDCDYAIDHADGATGLLYRQKHGHGGSLEDRLQRATRCAVRACCLLEQDPQIEGDALFDAGRIELLIADRLQAPNTPETFERLRDPIASALGRIYDGAGVQLTHIPEPRRRFTVRATVEPAPGVAELAERLGVAAAPAR